MSVSERYGHHPSRRDSRTRLLRWLDELDHALAPDADVERLVAADTRRLAFMLEGLLRLYRRRHAALGAQHAEVKRLEDAFGVLDHAAEMAHAAAAHAIPGPALEYLRERRDRAHADLEALLAARWTADAGGAVPAVRDQLEALAGLDWDGVGADRAFLRGEMARSLRKLEGLDLDIGALEAGIHELRRRLRWLPIQLTALGDFAVLVDDLHPVPAYAALLDDPIAASPFARLPPAGEDPVCIPRSLYIANTRAIGDLGDIKDGGQLIEAVAHALHASGLERKRKKALREALALLGKKMSDWKDVFRRARAIHDEIRRTRLVRHLRKAIEP